ncbi:MAG TPA: ATP synthase F1 subunit epsilon [Polyangiaceae bacterium]|nr:ATP synthase F1 subunit epsilon [Polyangiaceae bacterium]
MADTIALEIVTPDGLKLKEAVNELTAPSVQGEFGVLPQHRPMLAALATGIVTYVQDGKTQSVAVGPGFVEVTGDKALLLTDRFITKDAIDAVRTRLELKEVDDALDHFKGDPNSAEYAELVERELWAAAQLELHGDPPPPRISNVSSVGTHEDYAKTAQAEGDTEGEAAPHAEDAPKH